MKMQRGSAVGKARNLMRKIELTLRVHASDVNRDVIQAESAARILYLQLHTDIQPFGKHVPLARTSWSDSVVTGMASTGPPIHCRSPQPRATDRMAASRRAVRSVTKLPSSDDGMSNKSAMAVRMAAFAEAD